MCGIAGYYGAGAPTKVAWMARQLVHRGPDDGGVWVSPKRPLALGNRRLKIIDLSPLGHQPMQSPDGRWVLTFNGEIYNYVELRQELARAGYQFRSQTDTEVLLAALVSWGRDALNRVNGVFAFALWDEAQGSLLLARDRLGVKPLYYADRDGEFSFGSEATTILASGLVSPEIDSRALQSFLRLLWVPEPNTLFAGILKLAPGHLLTWDGKSAEVAPYWELPLPDLTHSGDMESASAELREVLGSAIRRQLRADVPVGIFLSGGLDSTAILDLASSSSETELRAYSVGLSPSSRSEEGALDDVRYARIAANAYGVPHHEIVLSPNVTELLPKIVRHLEDPVADPAAINCYLVCEAARQTSTVLLSGTGADELFGGYRKYVAESMASQYRRMPGALRRSFLEPISRRLPIAIGRIGLRHVRMAKKFLRYASASEFDGFLGYSSYYDAHELVELLGEDTPHGLDPYLGAEALHEAWMRRGVGQPIDRMTYVDLKYYLPGLGLAYMDKASMAASVEVRVPLIDDAVVDMVARLPDSFKIRGSRTKVILREAMRGRIPPAILTRPKAPFAAPIRSWLRKDLDEMVGDFLSPTQIRSRGLLSPDVVERIIREHRQGREDHSLRIWALLTLEVWIREFLGMQDRFKAPDDLTEIEPLSTAASA